MTEQQAISEWQRQSGRAEAMGFDLVMTGLGFQFDGQTFGSLVAVKAYLDGVAKERNRQFKNQAHASFDRPMCPFLVQWGGGYKRFPLDAACAAEAKRQALQYFDRHSIDVPADLSITPIQAANVQDLLTNARLGEQREENARV